MKDEPSVEDMGRELGHRANAEHPLSAEDIAALRVLVGPQGEKTAPAADSGAVA